MLLTWYLLLSKNNIEIIYVKRLKSKKQNTKNNPIKRTLAVLLYSAGRSVMCRDLCHFRRYATDHQ
jgi:hypothetical protein